MAILKGVLHMITKKRNSIAICILISIVLLTFITTLYADAAELSVSAAVKPKLTYTTGYSKNGFSGFSEGLAAVAQRTKEGRLLWGFINASGKEVIPCKYLSVTPFYKGLAVICVSSDYRELKYGIIDKTGKLIVPAKYDRFVEGNYINGYFTELFAEGIARVAIDNKYGYIDKSGREVTSCKYDYTRDFSDGRALVMRNGKYGYIDTAGKEIIPLKYGKAESFSDGYASVNPDYSSTEVGNTTNLNPGKWGLIDKDGNEVIPPKYDYIGNFTEGLAPVNIGGGYPTGSFSGTAIVYFSGGKWGYIDTEGNEVIPVQYKMSLPQNFHNGHMTVDINGERVSIDTSGRQVEREKYDFVYEYHNGYAKVNLGRKCGFIDINGNEIVTPKYDDVYDFSNGLAPVCIKSEKKYEDAFGTEVTEDIDKWGYVNTNGKEVIPLKYKSAGIFNDGVAEVSLADRSFYIDSSGKEVVLPRGTNWAGKYSEGLRSFQIDTRGYGFVDTTGKIVVQPQYNSVSNFFGGLSLVEKDGKYGILKLIKATDKPAVILQNP